MKKVFVCTNFRPFSGQPSCAFRGSEKLMEFLKEEVKLRKLDIVIESSVCLGHCPRGPNIKPAGGDFIHEADAEKLTQWLDRL